MTKSMNKIGRIASLTLCLMLLISLRVQSVDLVDISSISPNIKVEMRYATTSNFMSRAVYSKNVCLLRLATAERLVGVQKELSKIGLGLKVWDCYRPIPIQRLMFSIVGNPRYVANPSSNPKHTRGSSVDLTLIDLETGKELPMPTPFDTFSPAAASDAKGVPNTQNREVLKAYMRQAGFISYRGEWWHFDDPNWRSYNSLNIPL